MSSSESVKYYELPRYPESSCPCTYCPNPYPFFQKDLPPTQVAQTNLSVEDCHINPRLNNCTDYQVFDADREPVLGEKKPRHIKVLNKDFGLKLATDFVKKECFDHPQECPRVNPMKVACDGSIWVSNDPRIRNPAINQLVPLDRPPYTGDVKLRNVYNEDLRGYGQNYKTYRDIHAGQIQYYLDPDLSEPYFEPNFAIRSDITKSVFQDPMGALKPQYDRVPIAYNNYNISDYSFDRDQMGFREDLMSKQMRVMDQQEWKYRWGKNNFNTM